MPNFKSKPCQDCGVEYTPTGRCAKRCPMCAEKHHKEYMREAQFKYREKLGKPVHVGRGGSNKMFTDHPSFSSGIGNFHKLRKVVYQEVQNCEACGKDLSNAGRYEKCVHHIDHDRTHNVRENLMLLCKRCHQIHHDCVSNLPNGSGRCNDYPQGVGSRRDPKRTAPINGVMI